MGALRSQLLDPTSDDINQQRIERHIQQNCRPVKRSREHIVGCQPRRSDTEEYRKGHAPWRSQKDKDRKPMIVPSRYQDEFETQIN